MKTVLFGLDGATFTILDHLVAEDVMPNLGEFLKRGVRATLLSTPTPITPQAWTTLATGRSAGHHGLHDFIRPEQKGESIYFRVNDSRDNHCETIWRYASRNGKRVTVLNYFGTAPPERINGHSMPGFVAGRHLRRTSYPPDLFTRLQQVEGFDVKVLGVDEDFEREALRDMPPERWCPWIRHHIARERVWFGVLEHLMKTEPSDLAAVVFDGVDKIQHLAYRFLDPALVPAQATPWESEVIALCRTYFRQIDDFLGRTLSLAGRWGRVFIVSDHGFTATREIVYINKWLHDQGLLRWREDLAEDDQNANFSEHLTQFAGSFDLSKTKAYALLPSCNGIYLNVPSEEYSGFREDLIRRLLQIKAPDGGQVITEVKKREDYFPGPFMKRVPDLTLTLRDFSFISVLNARSVVIPRPQPAGTHHPHGVLLGTGPGIKEGSEVALVNILDVAPLLLHSLGLEIPAEMEGQFPNEVYDAAYLASDPPRCQKIAKTLTKETKPGLSPPEESDMSETEQAIIFERLKSLGYIE
jgi:predicted AlkP superfamily phosphohydrolase/phosphomutase